MGFCGLKVIEKKDETVARIFLAIKNVYLTKIKWQKKLSRHYGNTFYLTELFNPVLDPNKVAKRI